MSIFSKSSIRLFGLVCCLSLVTNLFSQTKPVLGLNENTPNVVGFTNVRVVVSPGNVIENASLVIRDNNIESVGKNAAIPADALVRDLTGRTIYAGFIDLYTNYGIAKPQKKPAGPGGSAPVQQPSDGAVHWNKNVRPEKRAADLFKHEEKEAKSFRKSGITTVMIFPRTGIFRGTGALVLLNDAEKTQTILSDQAALGMSMSKGGPFTFSFNVESYPSSLMGVMALIRQTFHDTKWYKDSWSVYNNDPAGKSPPEKNHSFAALQFHLNNNSPMIIEVSDEFNLLRAANLAQEFNLNMWIRGSGTEYRRLDAVKKTGLKLIVPVGFPETPKVATLEEEADVTLRDLRHWDFAPENAGRLAKANIPFTLTSSMMKKTDDFLKNVRIAVERGLEADQALAALTTTPAAWLNMTSTLGSVEKGKTANFVITDGDIFNKKTKIYETWVGGKRYEITPSPTVDVRGTWSLTITTGTETDTGAITLTGSDMKPAAELRLENKKLKPQNFALEMRRLSFSFPSDSLGKEGIARLSGMVEDKTMNGSGSWPDGNLFSWTANFTKPMEEKSGDKKDKPIEMSTLKIVYPEGAYGISEPPPQPETILIKNATIWTSGAQGKLENADMLVKRGKINAIGKNISAPRNAVIIDAAGKHVTPGIIDPHSHTASSDPFVNELTYSITSEVRMDDVINSDDINIYRQLAGGVTSTQLLHGSGNSIGGQSAILKYRWGATPEEMKFKGSFPSIKFALGENVKRANVANDNRYPKTRMGVEQFFTSWFQAAKDYQKEWGDYTRKSKKNKNMMPPRKNLRLDALVEILGDKRIIHCHSYRQDEILALMRVGEAEGFRVWTFTHILEGYKVADIMQKHGAMASTFSDWWGYKFEVYDAIPYNGPLMHEQGVVVSFNSDSGELARRLNTEAAKAVKYGNIAEEEALKFVTINPAKQLRIEHRVGSLEPSKDADFVIWSGNPLSTYTICQQTWIDGRKYFDLNEDEKLREKTERERVMLVQKALKLGSKASSPEEKPSKPASLNEL